MPACGDSGACCLQCIVTVVSGYLCVCGVVYLWCVWRTVTCGNDNACLKISMAFVYIIQLLQSVMIFVTAAVKS